MKHLLEAINRGILRGLNENNIELLTDLDDIDPDQLDSLQTKNINNKIHALYKYFPKTKEELVQIIKAEVERKGWNCSLNHIDVSRITDMSKLFSSSFVGYGLGEFNGDISRWDVSNAENMKWMFDENESFNQPIGDWDVSNVTDMGGMFDGAYSFNQPLDRWDVSNVTHMDDMFKYAKSFNQPIGGWDVSNVTDMYRMFDGAKSFKQDLSKWKIKTKCSTVDMFHACPIKQEYKPKGIKK